MSEQAEAVTKPRPARRRLPPVHVNWRVLLPLVAATLLLLLGLFLAWQGWLLWRVQNGVEQAQVVRQAQVRLIGEQIATTRQQVEHALAERVVLQPLADGETQWPAAETAFRQLLPTTRRLEFYSPALLEIIQSDDIARFGYDRAALLMLAQAQRSGTRAPVQVRGKQDDLSLVLALPAADDARVLAYAIAYLPFAPILRTFQDASISGAGLELRQGDGRGDRILAGIGDVRGSSLGDVGVPIDGSSLRIAAVEPEEFIVVPLPLALQLIAAALCLLGGLAALWLRQAGMQRVVAVLRREPKHPSEEMTLAETLLRDAEPGAATPAKTQPAAAPSAAARRSNAPIHVDRSIFRAYDIRGIVGESLSTDIAELIGRAIGSEARDRGLNEIVVGRDGRLSGPDLVAALVSGLRASGMDVIDIGLAATPTVYFAAYQLNTGSCIAVTGSHNPPDYNGFKIVLGGETLAEQAIQDLYGRIVEKRFNDGAGGFQQMDVSRDYLDRIADDVQLQRKLRVVVDCGNGVPGAIAPALLEAIGCEVLPLYCDVDGTFPNHHPDPSDPHNLQDLILSVKQTDSDLGLAFDGDGDRLGVVTKTGQIIYPDRLLMLFAIDVLTRNPGATIIYDVKCTGHLQPLILQHGGSPLMWKTGHSLVKSKMREIGAELAGEMSGHFFFKERWYGFDDGLYAAARLLEIIAADPEERTAQEIFDELPYGVSTPELKIPLREGEHYRFMETFARNAKFDGARLTTIDGVRADWPDGWGLVRASNTTPVLVLRFDADDAAALARIQDVFRKQLLAMDAALSLPF